MTEQVQCAECADLYDSEEHPFCPRCGALASASTPMAAVQLANRSDPRRRRVQVAGIMMLATGGIVLLLGLAWLGFGGFMAQTMFDTGLDQPSSALLFNIHDADGVPVEGAIITVTALGDEMVQNVTGAEGLAWFAPQSNAFVDIHVAWSDGNWSKRIAAVGLGSDELVIDIDTAAGEPAVPVLDEGMARQSVRVLGGLAILMGIGPVAGGINALRLKRRNTVIAGVATGGLPWLILFFASMSIAVLLVLGLYIGAFIFVRQGRALFTS